MAIACGSNNFHTVSTTDTLVLSSPTSSANLWIAPKGNPPLILFCDLSLAPYTQSAITEADTPMDNFLNRSFYMETVQESAVAEEKVIRQRGAIGTYAQIRIEVRPLSRGQGIVLNWNAGLNIPSEFVSAIFQGIQDAMARKALAEPELTDICLSVEDGSYHEIDSTADAFREAAKIAAAEAIRRARPVILEAFSLVTVTAPHSIVDLISAMLVSHGGKAQRSSSEGHSVAVTSLPAGSVSSLIEELLRVSEGSARISISRDGFRPRTEPPDSPDSWPSYT